MARAYKYLYQITTPCGVQHVIAVCIKNIISFSRVWSQNIVSNSYIVPRIWSLNSYSVSRPAVDDVGGAGRGDRAAGGPQRPRVAHRGYEPLDHTPQTLNTKHLTLNTKH